MRSLFRFHGGVHPPQNKEESTAHGISTIPLPARLIVPLQQHNGEPAGVLVQPGERVLKGQRIGEARGALSAAVHAPTSGTVLEVALHAVAHPSGLPDLCVVIEADGADEWVEQRPVDYLNLDKKVLLAVLRDAGIAGLGGATFPTHAKLQSSDAKRIDCLVINGAECEPYITCDDVLMRQRAAQIVRGVEIIHFLLPAKRILIAIEDNKPLALAALQEAVRAHGSPARVVAVPTIYPSGGAKQLIRVLTGIEVPANERASDHGVQCFNIGTVFAVYRAVDLGQPLISRIVTVAGNVERARNFEALLGTPIASLLAAARPLADTNAYLMGGPLMGFILPSADVPVVKATNCVVAMSPKLFPPPEPEMPCIRCTRCAEVCPADLQPQELYWQARAKDFAKAEAYSLFDCIECGACSYVCPSRIPLVHYYRHAKSEVRALAEGRKAAAAARERYEQRKTRLGVAAEDRPTAQAASGSATPSAVDPRVLSGPALAAAMAPERKHEAIAAAIARAKERKVLAETAVDPNHGGDGEASA